MGRDGSSNSCGEACAQFVFARGTCNCVSPIASVVTEGKRPLPKKAVTAYVVGGFLLPWLAVVVAAIRYGRYDELVAFPSHLFGSGYNYFLIACLNAIPFAVIAGLAIGHFKFSHPSAARELGIVVGALVAIFISAVYQTLAWFNILGPHPDSLTGVIFIFLPGIVTVSAIASGVCAWIARVIWQGSRW